MVLILLHILLLSVLFVILFVIDVCLIVMVLRSFVLIVGIGLRCLVVEFTNDELFSLERLCVGRIMHCEVSYRDNVNCRPEYAAFVGDLATKYYRLLLKIHPGYHYITESDSFNKFLCV